MNKGSLPVVDGGVVAEAPYVILPRASDVFRARAARFRSLAAGHPAGDWLMALARLCDAQHAAVAAGEGSAWDTTLDRIVAMMNDAPLPAPARDALARVRDASVEQRAAWAAAVRGDEDGEHPDAATAPFVAAALQVHFTCAAEQRTPSTVERTSSDCPVCAAPPVAGIVMGDEKVRYLACSLCATAWHRVRVQCATCGSPSALAYYSIERDSADGVTAEACASCKTYVKLFHRERRPDAEPVADDAATIALDILMSDEGYARGGVNLLVAG
jgi:FdhE protein